MIRKLIGMMVCWRNGHKRGRPVSRDQTHKRFECPRCGRRTTYPIRVQA